MRLRGDDETVSALAPVVESDETDGDDEPVAAESADAQPNA